MVVFSRRLCDKSTNNDVPLSYMNSKAKDYRLRDSMMVDEKTRKRQKYSIPLGLTTFGLLMYFCYWVDYGEEKKQKEAVEARRQKLVDYLTAGQEQTEQK